MQYAGGILPFAGLDGERSLLIIESLTSAVKLQREAAREKSIAQSV